MFIFLVASRYFTNFCFTFDNFFSPRVRASYYRVTSLPYIIMSYYIIGHQKREGQVTIADVKI